MSKFLQWEIIKNNHAFIMKRPHVRTLSKEPGNIRNVHGFKANGIIHKKTIDIQPAKDNKGIVITRKRVRRLRHPATSTSSVVMKAGPRRLLWKLARTINQDKYRRDLKKACVRRASAILQSQKAAAGAKKRGKRSAKKQ